MYESGQASVSLRVEVLRGGGVYTVLQPVSAPEVQMRADSALKMSFKGEFYTPDEEIRWLTDRIRPMLTVDGQEYPVGLYIGTTPRRRTRGGGSVVVLEAYSVLYLAQRVTLEPGYIIRAGTNYIGAAQDLLRLAGITMYTAEPTDKRIPTDRADWSVGTTVLDVLNGLLAEINYREVWVDLDGIVHLDSGREEVSAAAEAAALAESGSVRLVVYGYSVTAGVESLSVSGDTVKAVVLGLREDGDTLTVTVRGTPDPGGGDVKPVGVPDHVYTSGQYSVISSDVDVVTDYFDKANVFRAVCSSPDLTEPLVAEVVNDDPLSPFSTTVLGVRIVQVEEVDAVADLAELQAMAAQMRYKALQTVETIEFVTALEPTHTVWDSVGLDVGGETGIYTEIGWRMVLDASGEMRHTAERTVFI
jgi:hypothetical protein